MNFVLYTSTYFLNKAKVYSNNLCTKFLNLPSVSYLGATNANELPILAIETEKFRHLWSNWQKNYLESSKKIACVKLRMFSCSGGSSLPLIHNIMYSRTTIQATIQIPCVQKWYLLFIQQPFNNRATVLRLQDVFNKPRYFDMQDVILTCFDSFIKDVICAIMW